MSKTVKRLVAVAFWTAYACVWLLLASFVWVDGGGYTPNSGMLMFATVVPVVHLATNALCSTASDSCPRYPMTLKFRSSEVADQFLGKDSMPANLVAKQLREGADSVWVAVNVEDLTNGARLRPAILAAALSGYTCECEDCLNE